MSSLPLKYADPVTITGTGPYPIPHEYGPSSEVKVTIQTSANTLVEISNSDIILDPLESDTTGNLYISSSVATTYNGAKLYIRRATTVDQDWVSIRGKLQFALQNQLDAQSRAIQELQEKASRSVIVFDKKIPYIFSEASKTLIWNDEGTALSAGPSVDEISSAQTYAEQAGISKDAATSSAAEAALYDGPRVDDVPALLANTALTLTTGQPGTVAVGDFVQTRKEGFAYQVADAAATDHNIVTAGGLKLEVVSDQSRGLLDTSINSTLQEVVTKATELDITAALMLHSYTQTADIAIPTGAHIDGNGATINWNAGDRLINFLGSVQRANRLSDGEPNVFRVKEQHAGLNYIDTFVVGEGSNFSVGQAVVISCGIDPFDADDSLWEFSRAFKVVKVDGDRVTIDDIIPCHLSDGPFYPGSPAYTASPYADATSYAVGDCVTSNETGTGAGTAVWRSEIAHTSSGATVSADGILGVTWVKLSDSQGSLFGTSARDGRCVIQVMSDTEMVHDASISELNMASTRETGTSNTGLQLRSCLDVTIENTTVNGKLRIAAAASEYANRITFKNVYFYIDPAVSDFARAYSSYMGKSTFLDSNLIGGASNRAPVFLENWGTFEATRTTISPATPPGVASHWGFFASPGIIRLRDCDIGPFDIPFRQNFSTELFNYSEIRKPLEIDAIGNRFNMAGKGFRLADDWNPQLSAWADNNFTIYDTGIPDQETLFLTNARLVRISATFVPADSKPLNTVEEFAIDTQEGRMAPAYGPMVILGTELFWSNPDPSADFISFRTQIVTDGGAVRYPLSNNAANAKQIIYIENANKVVGRYAFNGAVGSDGSGRRCVGAGERLQWLYGSGVNSTISGEVTASVVALVGE